VSGPGVPGHLSARRSVRAFAIQTQLTRTLCIRTRSVRAFVFWTQYVRVLYVWTQLPQHIATRRRESAQLPSRCWLPGHHATGRTVSMQMVSRRQVPWHQGPDATPHGNVHPNKCQRICLQDQECQRIFLTDVAYVFRMQNVMVNGIRMVSPMLEMLLTACSVLCCSPRLSTGVIWICA
jgi:hypothetical protein